MAWDDNFNKLFESKLPVDEYKEWRFALEEHKTKGTMNMNVREFKCSESYSGPTKNGFIINVQSIDQVEKFQKMFNEFFEKVKEML